MKITRAAIEWTYIPYKGGSQAEVAVAKVVKESGEKFE